MHATKNSRSIDLPNKFFFQTNLLILFSVCHEVFLPHRENRTQIVGYEEPENVSYCLVMVRYGGGSSGLAPVSVATILESFVPIERNSTVPKKGMIY